MVDSGSTSLVSWYNLLKEILDIDSFLYFSDIFKTNKLLTSFQEIIDNVFLPLFEATNNPSKHPELHKFLQYVIGFDSVDDESKPENPLLDQDMATPEKWNEGENPCYAYYIYYMYANMTVLNQFRAWVVIKI